MAVNWYEILVKCDIEGLNVTIRKIAPEIHYSLVYPKYKKQVKLNRFNHYEIKLETKCTEGLQGLAKEILLSSLKNLLNQQQREIQKIKAHKSTTIYKHSK